MTLDLLGAKFRGPCDNLLPYGLLDLLVDLGLLNLRMGVVPLRWWVQRLLRLVSHFYIGVKEIWMPLYGWRERYELQGLLLALLSFFDDKFWMFVCSWGAAGVDLSYFLLLVSFWRSMVEGLDGTGRVLESSLNRDFS